MSGEIKITQERGKHRAEMTNACVQCCIAAVAEQHIKRDDVTVMCVI
jgi:hypothetical protein